MTITRVVGVIINENKEVLLNYRINEKSFNEMWANSIGMIDIVRDKNMESAAKRALEEDYEIKVKIIKHLCNYKYYREEILKGNVLYGTYLGFLAQIVEGIPSIKKPDQMREIKYFPMSNLPNNISPFTKEYINVFLKTK